MNQKRVNYKQSDLDEMASAANIENFVMTQVRHHRHRGQHRRVRYTVSVCPTSSGNDKWPFALRIVTFPRLKNRQAESWAILRLKKLFFYYQKEKANNFKTEKKRFIWKMKLLPALAGLLATTNASLDMTNLDMPNDDGKKNFILGLPRDNRWYFLLTIFWLKITERS